MAELAVSSLEPIGRSASPTAYTQELGNAWAAGRQSLALRVPSVVIPEELNLLLDPVHPAMSRVEVADSREFRFDFPLR